MNDGLSRMPAWESWRAACALDLTAAEQRQLLVSFLARRFHAGVEKAGAGISHSLVPGDADCARLFESWCALHTRRDGKAYKRWLFARGDRSPGAVESGVCLLMRKVVREWLRREAPRNREISLQQPLTPEGLTLADLLPGSAADHAGPGEAEWRKAFLAELKPELTQAQRVALKARHAGIALRDPKVLAAAGLGRTALNACYRDLVLRIAARVRRDFDGASPDEATGICLRCLEELAAEKNPEVFADKTRLAGCREGKETL